MNNPKGGQRGATAKEQGRAQHALWHLRRSLEEERLALEALLQKGLTIDEVEDALDARARQNGMTPP